MKKWQVYVVIISLFVHLVASRVETIIEGRMVEITNKLNFFNKRRVDITNKVGDGLTLTFHCKSKDDDLGVQILAPDQMWSFRFRPNFWGTTLFYCNFKWAGESHWFNIYDDDRDGDVGHKPCLWYICGWDIKRSEVCRLKDNYGKDICYHWKK
ncbi:unnamed protein product [Eruca vesicaria subsp. sativa]|uniref:S-protein homolog n=1 Tax=Eruca vesicaria subsp. sativa TaxID=29727 RepID=A0ABC8J3K5_ERUVS|nr:unnamed protein product [Eruca vesicaria subsp. sativa]